MKKHQRTLVLIFVMIFLQESEASWPYVFLADLPDDLLIYNSKYKSKDVLQDIILLPKSPTIETSKMAGKMIERIDRLPKNLLEKIRYHRIYIQLFEGDLTDHSSFKHLKGVKPRGYRSQAITWDDVPGAGGSTIVMAKIGYSDKGNGHGSINLELHELAHSIDKIIFNNIRHNDDFLMIWEEERYNLFDSDHYLSVYPEEYFAECFAYFYKDATSNQILFENAPKTYSFIEQLQ